MGSVGIASQLVAQVRQVLSPQYLHGAEVSGRRTNLAVDHRRGVAQPGEVLATTPDHGDVEGTPRRSASSANPLNVVGDAMRQRRQKHR